MISNDYEKDYEYGFSLWEKKFNKIGAILSDDHVINLRTEKPFSTFGKQTIFRRFEKLSPILDAELGSNETTNLRNSQYEFNKINYDQLKEREQMFNEDELKFIKETAEKDLKSLDQRVEVTVNEMARLGKNLSDIKLVQSRLQSILQSIIDDETKKPTYNFATTSRCC